MDKRLKTLIITFFAMFVFAMVLQTLPPVLPMVIQDLKLSHAQGGLLMGFFALPGIFFALPGGVLVDKYGPRIVGLVSLIIMLAGILIVASGTTFFHLSMGRFISGLGASSIMIVAAQAVSRSFLQGKLGIAMGIFNAGVPAGTIFSHNFFSFIGSIWGWRFPVYISAVACVILILVFWFYTGFKSAEENSQAESFQSSAADIFVQSVNSVKKHWYIWIVAGAWMAFISSRIGSLTFAPDYFGSIGFDAAYAGFLASLFTMGSLVLSPFVGHLLDKTGKPESFMMIGGVILAFLFVLISVAPAGYLIIAASIGLAAALIPVSIFSLVPKFLPEEKLGLGYGILRICENTGMLAGPFFVGLTYDLSGAYFYGFVLMAILSLLVAISAVVLKHYLKKELDSKALFESR